MLSYDKLKIIHNLLEKYSEKFDKDSQLILELTIDPNEGNFAELRITLGDRRYITATTVEELLAKLIMFIK